jgi:hypothetical protein
MRHKCGRRPRPTTSYEPRVGRLGHRAITDADVYLARHGPREIRQRCELLLELYTDGPLGALPAVVRRVVEALPDSDFFATITTAADKNLLAVLVDSALFLITVEPIAEDEASGSPDRQRVVVSRIPLEPVRCSVSFADHFEGGASTTLVRRWRFDLGRESLEFETRTPRHDDWNLAERFAKALAGELGWTGIPWRQLVRRVRTLALDKCLRVESARCSWCKLVRRVGPPKVIALAKARPERRNPRLSGGFCEADEGTRTLDLLHGKQTL